MKGRVCSGVHCIDLRSALDQKLGHLCTGKESVLSVFKEVLAFEGVVAHHGEVEEGVTVGGSRVHSMYDVMNSATKRDVVVDALQLRHQVQQVRDDS